MISIPARTVREIANRYVRRYRGFSIERTEHARGYLVHGVMHTEGFIVVRDGCNVMPGAAWFQDAAAAIEAIDVLLKTGHGPAFWTELARRSAAKDHALELATLLDEFLDLDDWTDDLIAPSSLIERAQQVSARIKRGERRDPGASRR